MAALNGRNFKKAYIDVPAERADVGFFGGSVQVLIDDSAAGVATDTINIGKLPKGAKVLSVTTVGLGTGGTVNVAPMALMTAETTVIATIGTTPTLPISVFVMYTCA